MICRFLGSIALLAATTACGDVVRNSRSAVLLVVDSMTAAPGGGFGAGTYSNGLRSDVLVDVTSPAPCTATAPCPTIYDDRGQVILRLVPKDISVAPTTNNQVTINRFHVDYVRADGRNIPGVDVPYGWDGAVTATVPPSGTATIGFEIVRHDAKKESPLVQLISSPQILNTITNVTFYGADQVGNAISVTASLSIEFGNFGDQ